VTQLKEMHMATKEWDKHIADFKKLSRANDSNDSKTMKRLVGNFLIFGKNAETLEDMLVKTLPKARDNGVTGDGLADFKKDKGFYDVYKMLQKNADMMYAAQQDLKVATNQARQTSDQIKALEAYIDKDVKARKVKPSPADLKELDKLRKEMATARKDLDIAGDMMTKSVDRKLATYVEKLGKNLDKLLDLAPKVEGDGDSKEKLPSEIQDKTLSVAVKKVQLLAKTISKHCETAFTKSLEDRKLAAPEMKAGGIALSNLKKLYLQHNGYLKKHAKVIKASEDQAKMKKAFETIEKAFKDSERLWKSTSADIVKKR